jgi:diguanylate cyclase (GGDEF)-like protein
LIIGTGEAAEAFYNAVADNRDIILTGVLDVHAGSPAKEDGDAGWTEALPLFTDVSVAMRSTPHVIMDLAGNEEISSRIEAEKTAATERISAQGARLFLSLLRRDHQRVNGSPEEWISEQATKLTETGGELRHPNKLKSPFIATVSHELRTPLNAILRFSELLRDERNDSLTEEQKDHIDHIHGAGSHLLELVNHLLDPSKMESRKLTLQYERIPLGKIVSDVEAVIRPLMALKSQEFEARIADTAGCIHADRMAFIQILYNLLSNAMKFTDQGGHIMLEADILDTPGPGDEDGPPSFEGEPAEASLVLHVSDTGPGIPEEDRERIFEAFERGNNTQDGTGLGLALTKNLVALHGGHISVASETGQGSRFTIVIPQPTGSTPGTTTSPPGIDEEGEDDGEEPMAEPDDQGAPLLLVEDDAATAELITHYLNGSGYRVEHVFKGGDALKRAQDIEPFAVILDIMLPDKDGWQVLRELKASHITRDIPVIILSIIDNPSLGFALGATDYLLKPVKKDVFLEKISRLSGTGKREHRFRDILCVDANENTRERLKEILETAGYNVLNTATGKDGLEKALLYRPDLVILDLLIPDMGGFALSRALKSNEATGDTPIIVLTEKDITVGERLRLAGNVESVMQKHCLSKEDLLAHVRDLEITPLTGRGLLDTASGLFDRSYFQIRLAQEIYRADRYYTTFSVMMFDIDDFILYAQLNGVQKANNCIRKMADFLRQTARGSDVLARYGFGGFAILLSSTTEEGTRTVAERFLSFIETYPFPGMKDMPKKSLTASIAVVHYNRVGPCTAEQMIFEARELVRNAYSAGGANIRIYGQQESPE